MIRAIIFDFDGTLADTIDALREAINMTMRQYGYPEHSNENVRAFINNGARELVRRAMPAELQDDEALLDRVLADYLKHYAAVYLHTERAYDGIPELISELHASGIAIGVLSNKPHAYMERLCAQILPAGVCDAVQGMILGKPAKPDPYLSRLVADRLGVSPEECVMVGDSDVDIRTAKSAGMIPVSVSWGYRDEAFLRANAAEHLAATPDGLRRLLSDLMKEKGSN